MDLAGALADISFWELATVAAMALVASLVGGVAGYGTGALMPLVLVPIIGAEPVVPIIALSALLTNTSRAVAFRRAIDFRRTITVLLAAVPTCVIGAYGYTLLTSTGAMLVIGAMLAASVPLRSAGSRWHRSVTASWSAAPRAPGSSCCRCSWRSGSKARR